MKCLIHIMINDKFIASYIEFIKNNFNFEKHRFFIIDGVSEEEFEIPNYKNVYFYKSKYNKNKVVLILKLFKFLYQSLKNGEKIYFHSLFNKKIILFLFVFRNFLKKSYWIIWGGDLYCYKNRKNKLINKIWYKIEDYVKGHFKGYITLMKGDYRLAQKWYKAKGELLYSFSYPSNLYKKINIEVKEKDYMAIQVGNSADPSNNHFEIFEKLKKYKKEKIKLYCPLSYGNKIYANEVIEKGKDVFGEKFTPLIEFMEYKEYLEFLSKIDIAIFAHDRQQAFGNITSLLSMKKTVYLKDEITATEMLKELGIKIKSFNKLENLEVFDNEILKRNKEIIKERFSEERLIKEWKSIFED